MRPYVLHEFSEPTLPSGEPLASGMSDKNAVVFPVGTIVSLVLESRDKRKASKWCTDSYPSVEIDDEELTRDLPAITRSEELFFRIVEYLPRPRDRYVVERIDHGAFIYAPMVDDCFGLLGNHGRRNRGAEISLQVSNAELQNKFFPLNEDTLYQARRILDRAQGDLRKGKITQEEFEVRRAKAKQEYTETKALLRAERDVKYPIGSTVKIRIVPVEEEAVHETSAFLQGGDQITCKRKNIHFVGEPGTSFHVYQPKEKDFPKAWCVTTWGGQLLDPSVRNLVGRGHLVRAVCAYHFSSWRCETVNYFSIVDVLADDCVLGVLRAYYTAGWGEDMLHLIGKYFIIRRDAISEIPHMWPENGSLEAPVNAAKLSSNFLAVTGISAMKSS